MTRQRIFKLLSAGIGMLCGLLAKKLLRAGYQLVRRDATAPSPFDPTRVGFSWINALAWAIAAGIGLGMARVVSNRIATMSWEVATGTLPPGVVEEPTVT